MLATSRSRPVKRKDARARYPGGGSPGGPARLSRASGVASSTSPPMSLRLGLAAALATALASALPAVLVAQGPDYRTIDGRGNNRAHVHWGAAHDTVVNSCRPNFADGLSAPAGPELPNARVLSNALFRQSAPTPSPENLNDLYWAFGQFLDHDIVFTGGNPAERMDVAVPTGDPLLDPDSTGRVTIPVTRSMPMTGDAGTLRRYGNEITAFVDGSAVYGSDEARAAWLRAYEGGRLLTSAGDLPPFNTLTGEFGGPIDRDAPHMEGMRSPNQRVLICGDTRANENSLLAAMHTAWLREHNRLADSLAAADPDLGDEALYQAARRLVVAELQHVVYAEWLPYLGVAQAPDTGYDPAVHPGISNEFAAAGFRFGHSMVGSELALVGEDGRTLRNSPLALREVFFDPISVVQTNGVAALLRGAATHRQQRLDGQVVEDLRSFLFGTRAGGGMDLVALNITRGRDRGVATFGQMREDLDLPPVPSFEALTGEGVTSAALERFYGSVMDLDPWVGLLAERRDGMAGPTLRALLTEQFERLRAGDRYFYTHEGVLTPDERTWVEAQTLSSVLARSSGVRLTGPSFEAGGLVGAAFAKTQGREPAATLTADALLLHDIGPDVTAVTLTDVSGRTVATWVAESGQTAFALDGGLPAGAYVAAVRTAAGTRGVLVGR